MFPRSSQMIRLALVSTLFLLFSCEDSLRQERYWFNAGFDSTYYMLFRPPGTTDVKPETRARNVAKSLKDKARNSKELARCTDALFAGVHVITDVYQGKYLPKGSIVINNPIETEVGDWECPALTTWPEEYTREYYEATMPMGFPGCPLYSYDEAKRNHEEELARSREFLNYLRENKEALRKAYWEQVYLRDRKFRDH